MTTMQEVTEELFQITSAAQAAAERIDKGIRREGDQQIVATFLTKATPAVVLALLNVVRTGAGPILADVAKFCGTLGGDGVEVRRYIFETYGVTAPFESVEVKIATDDATTELLKGAS